MLHCTNCGTPLNPGAKFCNMCGIQVSVEDEYSKRQTVYEGKIHKCPNCGQAVEAFQDDCPFCGYQFRDVQGTSSVKELADKLEKVTNEKGIGGFINTLYTGVSTKVQNQVQLIQNFAIPNTSEDLWEFLILASSNIQVSSYEQKSSSAKALSDAWRAKFDQAYHKAMLVIDDPDDINRIKELYSSKTKEIKNAKIKTGFIFGALIGGWLLIMLLLLGSTLFLDPYSRKVEKENERLNAIVEEVYDCIDAGNYTLARAKVATLVFVESDDEAKQQWDETRENLLKVIEDAEQKTENQPDTRGE